MDLNRFNALNDLRKAEIIDRDGTYLAQRIKGRTMCFLYHLNSFWVEVFFVDRVVTYNCFEDTDYLEPYLNDVDISSIEILL